MWPKIKKRICQLKGSIPQGSMMSENSDDVRLKQRTQATAQDLLPSLPN